MSISYKPLWKLLIDHDMSREQLRLELGFSPNTIAKMGKNERVSLEVVERICERFNCQPGDVFEYIPNRKT